VEVGDHTVIVRAPGYVDFKWHKAIADREDASVPVDLEASEIEGGGSGTPAWLFFTVAGASAVALGAGAVFAVDAKGKSDEAQKADPLLRDQAEKDTIHSQAVTANVLFIGGAALAVGACVLAFTTNWHAGRSAPDAAHARVRVTPWLSASAGGVGAGGSF
jgi:hypothetical protein